MSAFAVVVPPGRLAVFTRMRAPSASTRVARLRARTRRVTRSMRRPSVVRDFGEDCVVEKREDAVVVAVPCANRSAFRSWVLGLVAGAEVLSPPEVRQDVIDWLDKMAGVR